MRIGVKPVESALEGFEAITRRHGEVGEAAGLIHLDEFAEGNAKDGIVATRLLNPFG
ncbi:MAG: hypothetical protein JJU00_16805 [Opitutales bacterium]|nr:hypothetical protein [Opitutales bacterium]